MMRTAKEIRIYNGPADLLGRKVKALKVFAPTLGSYIRKLEHIFYATDFHYEVVLPQNCTYESHTGDLYTVPVTSLENYIDTLDRVRYNKGHVVGRPHHIYVIYNYNK